MKIIAGLTAKKAVILGAGGFIGINLTNSLVAQGFNVICFDRIISPQWPSNVKSIIGDFNALPDELMNELEDALVFHLVNISKPSASTVKVIDEINNDLAGTLRYLEATKERNLRWIFFSSGGTVYGQNDANVITETSATDPICSYGIIKLAIEKYFALYGKLYNTNYVIVRPSNPYGPWQYPFQGQGIIATFLHKALNNEKIEIWGDGENVRDYIYIDDAVQGIIAAAVSGHRGEIYNIGTGQGYSINSLIANINSILNPQIKVEYMPTRSVDVRRNVLCIDKITSHTGWKQQVALDDGLVLTADWIKKYCDKK